MPSNRAVEVNKSRKLVIAFADEPAVARNAALVQVEATSLNRGEVRRALTRAAPGWRPGWDLAGTILRKAADGSGPDAGARVVGVLPDAGGWARRVAVPTSALAELPPGISFAQAACLPVAGLTAMYALEKRGSLVGRKVLITGATGGVGHLACQLARAAGAHIAVTIRSLATAEAVRAYGAHDLIVGDEIDGQLAAAGPYDLILDTVGGTSLAACLRHLAPRGVCVSAGVSAGAEVCFDAEAFFYATASLTGLVLFKELAADGGAAAGLARLLRLAADAGLSSHIASERPWTDVDEACRALLDRKVSGKIVLHMADDA